jgi:hypothetical protein
VAGVQLLVNVMTDVTLLLARRLLGRALIGRDPSASYLAGCYTPYI